MHTVITGYDLSNHELYLCPKHTLSTDQTQFYTKFVLSPCSDHGQSPEIICRVFCVCPHVGTQKIMEFITFGFSDYCVLVSILVPLTKTPRQKATQEWMLYFSSEFQVTAHQGIRNLMPLVTLYPQSKAERGVYVCWLLSSFCPLLHCLGTNIIQYSHLQTWIPQKSLGDEIGGLNPKKQDTLPLNKLLDTQDNRLLGAVSLQHHYQYILKNEYQ